MLVLFPFCDNAQTSFPFVVTIVNCRLFIICIRKVNCFGVWINSNFGVIKRMHVILPSGVQSVRPRNSVAIQVLVGIMVREQVEGDCHMPQTLGLVGLPVQVFNFIQGSVDVGLAVDEKGEFSRKLRVQGEVHQLLFVFGDVEGLTKREGPTLADGLPLQRNVLP
eukprot:Phypoly_transcript_15418.p1 GENE.Phypoly_transcript_15418~~Phypoly_transcript_15418.p1  ORF type:complete len:165 (+),score=2.39 Phypoly_transcript_15418:209-703(+)